MKKGLNFALGPYGDMNFSRGWGEGRREREREREEGGGGGREGGGD